LEKLKVGQIPSIIQSSNCIVSLENESSPVLNYNTSTVPAEALASGKCVLISNVLHKKEPYNKLENGKEILVVDSNNELEINKILQEKINNTESTDIKGLEGYKSFSKYNKFNDYINRTIELYKSTIESKYL